MAIAEVLLFGVLFMVWRWLSIASAAHSQNVQRRSPLFWQSIPGLLTAWGLDSAHRFLQLDFLSPT